MTKIENFPLSNDQILEDYKIAFMSRQASLIGRKEVLNGKAKFGIFGDGKEVAQVAMARAFEKGDWRAGYYRDQTFMLAIGEISIESFFAQLYADTNLENEPASGGRQMNSHFATRYYKEGEWVNQANEYNVAADLSPTAGQMAKLVGLGYASKLYRQSDALKNSSESKKFSNTGNEVAFGTIGNASTSEGHFWESINAAGVLQIPLAMSVWDDGYGISVEAKYQTTKSSISKILAGFQNDDGNNGYEIYTCKGWDYENLIKTYIEGVKKCRAEHNPALFHIEEVTQPQGHSTSGSHERYKSAERLQWEVDFDCLTKMKTWMIEHGVASESEIETLEKNASNAVEASKEKAWNAMQAPLKQTKEKAINLISNLISTMGDHGSADKVTAIKKELERSPGFQHRAVHVAMRKILLLARDIEGEILQEISQFEKECADYGRKSYNTHLYVENNRSRARQR